MLYSVSFFCPGNSHYIICQTHIVNNQEAKTEWSALLVLFKIYSYLLVKYPHTVELFSTFNGHLTGGSSWVLLCLSRTAGCTERPCNVWSLLSVHVASVDVFKCQAHAALHKKPGPVSTWCLKIINWGFVKSLGHRLKWYSTQNVSLKYQTPIQDLTVDCYYSSKVTQCPNKLIIYYEVKSAYLLDVYHNLHYFQILLNALHLVIFCECNFHTRDMTLFSKEYMWWQQEKISF